jgi:Mn2+/Fe2+ NRAMP family transporter
MLAIPVLAGSSSYAIAESFRWREGLYRNLAQARAFYGIIIISMIVGLAINFIGIDPINALIYAAVANGLVAPIVLALIVLLGSNRAVMGRWTNKPYVTVIGWLVTLLMAVAGVAAIIALIP